MLIKKRYSFDISKTSCLHHFNTTAPARNPIERAFSHYKLMVQFGHEDLSFEDAIKKESERISNEKEKITKGLYSFTHQHHTYTL